MNPGLLNSAYSCKDELLCEWSNKLLRIASEKNWSCSGEYCERGK